MRKAHKGPNPEISGSRGTISCTRTANTLVTRIYRAISEDGERGRIDAGMPEELRCQSIGVDDLIDAIIEDRKQVLTPEHARHVIEIMNKCYVVAGKKRALPLEASF